MAQPYREGQRPQIWRGDSSENYNPLVRPELPPEYQPRSFRGNASVPDPNDQPGEDLMSTLTALLHGGNVGPMASGALTDDPRVNAIQRYMEMQGSGPVPLQEHRPKMMGNFSGNPRKPLFPRDMTPWELEQMVGDMNRDR